jgi:hypothetical protein
VPFSGSAGARTGGVQAITVSAMIPTIVMSAAFLFFMIFSLLGYFPSHLL